MAPHTKQCIIMILSKRCQGSWPISSFVGKNIPENALLADLNVMLYSRNPDWAFSCLSAHIQTTVLLFPLQIIMPIDGASSSSFICRQEPRGLRTASSPHIQGWTPLSWDLSRQGIWASCGRAGDRWKYSLSSISILNWFPMKQK